MKINTRKATEIFNSLVNSYVERTYPFNKPEATPPQTRENLPSNIIWGSRGHALFLFTLCYWMRGGIDSHTAVRQLAKLYQAEPQLFLPENNEKLNPAKVTEASKKFGLGFNAEEIGLAWKKNLARIQGLYNGDPRRIFQGLSTYDEACERIQNKGKNGFLGFQEKMVSMLTYFFMDAGMVDKWNFPIPVDFHVLRIVFANEIITAEKEEANGNGFYTKPVLLAVREICLNYCIEKGVDPLILCEAVWLFSKLMCNRHPGNESEVGGRHGRKTELSPIKRWTASQSQSYVAACGSCVIESTCMHCVPSAAYYISGKIILRERRESPKQGLLSFSTNKEAPDE